MTLGSVMGNMRDVSKVLGSAWPGKMSYKALDKKRIHCKVVPMGREHYHRLGSKAGCWAQLSYPS